MGDNNKLKKLKQKKMRENKKLKHREFMKEMLQVYGGNTNVKMPHS
jgi:hypothetical protein